MTSELQCTWCGAAVQAEDGYRLGEPAGARHAVFCRLEHVVPWAMQGRRWEAGEIAEPVYTGDDLARCAHCGAALDDTRVMLVRHRGEHRVPDAFCSVEHAAEWAKAGGRWRS
jgi:hypothetical protein